MISRPETDSAAASRLTAAIVLALGTSAYAQVESFVNDGSFDWIDSLDPTLPPQAQDGEYKQGRFSQGGFQDYGYCGYYYDPDSHEYYWKFWYEDQRVCYGTHDPDALISATFQGRKFLRPLQPGEVVGPGAEWDYLAYSGIVNYSYCSYSHTYESLIGPDEAVYLGLRFLRPDGVHYGWLQVRAENPANDLLTALAWGYQQSPETPLRAGQTEGAWCKADLDLSGALDLFDFLAFTNLFNAGDPKADFEENGVLDLFDFLGYVNAFNTGC